MARYRHAKGPSALQVILIILTVIASLAILSGAAFAVYHFGFDKKEEPTDPPTLETFPEATLEQPPTEAPTEDPELMYTELAKDYMKNMSEDEKIYQMMIVTPEALTGVDVATIAGDATKEAVENSPVGGIVYNENNFEDADQTTELIKNTQSFAKTPMFIAVNEEGGDKAPVAKVLGTTSFDAMSTYADKGDDVAFENASTIAKDIKKFGFNLNLAPVANLEGDNAYSTDPSVAKTLVAQAVKGMQNESVISTLKYFPSSADTDKTTDDLRMSEFSPFVTSINEGAGIIAVSNIKATAIDEENPAFMSQRVVTELLIKELNFNGVVMTPNLSNENITSTYTTEQIVKGAIPSGVNLLFCPADADEYVDAIKAAIEDESITQEQIDESVTKILSLKFKFGLIPEPSAPSPSEIKTTQETVADTTVE